MHFSCGLLYVGAAHTGLQYISTEVTGMYRRVVGNMANITGMTHAWEGLQNALSLMPAHDIIHHACWGALHRSRNALDRCGSGPVRELVADSKGGKHSPITLVSDLWCQLPEPISCAMVLENWMRQHGVQTASPILCMQVCRYEGLGVLDRQPLGFGDVTFHLDVYTNSAGLEIAKAPYTLTAVVNYAGTSWQGHYQSAVCVGGNWLPLNDNAAPQIHDNLASWSMSGISHVWLVRSDLIRALSIVF